MMKLCWVLPVSQSNHNGIGSPLHRVSAVAAADAASWLPRPGPSPIE